MYLFNKKSFILFSPKGYLCGMSFGKTGSQEHKLGTQYGMVKITSNPQNEFCLESC